MKSYLRQLLILIGLVFACLGSCAAVFFGYSIVHCEQRKNPPTAPVYPGSTLQDMDFFLVGLDYSLWPPTFDVPAMSLATYYYSTPDAPEQVRAFYTQRGDLSGAYDQYVIGNAEPFGEYNVGIPNGKSKTGDGLTDYFIEIRWERCR